MRTGLCTDPRFGAHRPPRAHPERPERLVAIERALASSGVAARCLKVGARRATRAELERAHAPQFLDELEQIMGAGGPGGCGWFDPDTYYSEGSLEAAELAAGAAVELATRIAAGTLDNGAAFVRPPGHHATRDQAMGFCLLNNVAVAAAALRAQGARVAIFDWDVHHGNGTQDIFYAEPDVLYASTHEWPQYPGTGRVEDAGAGRGQGATVNLPLAAGTDGATYLAAYRARIAPALEAFRPDLLLVSAGFDSHRADPLGHLELDESTFETITQHLLSVQPRLLLVLEGGYDLDATASSSVRVMQALLG